MLLSEMAKKELIQLQDGKRMGFLSETELLFEPTTGSIIGFEIVEKKFPFTQNKKTTLTPQAVLWKDIVLIGDNRILFTTTTALGRISR